MGVIVMIKILLFIAILLTICCLWIWLKLNSSDANSYPDIK